MKILNTINVLDVTSSSIMRTGLVRKYGERSTVQKYVDVAIKHLGCSKQVHDTALKMCIHIAKNTEFSGRYSSMLAMTVVNRKYQDIPSAAWLGLCSYNTLLKHSKELKVMLEELDDFPTLKNRKVG